MNTRLAGLLAASTALIAGAALAQAPAAPAAPRAPPPPMEIQKVRPNLYFIVGGGGNSELLVTSDGALLVDTKNMNDKDYGDLMKLIGSVTDKPVKVVVDTHHHADHTGNNEKFIAAGAKVIGQETMPEIFKNYTTRLAPHTPASPTTLYAKTMDVRLGKSQAKLYHFGPGHTGADTVVYFPAQKAIAFGDLLVSSPTVPNYDAGNARGSLLGFDRALGEGLKLKWDVAFPGHGDKPLTRDEVKAYKVKIDQLISRIRDSINAGTPKDKLIASLKTDDLGFKIGGQFWAPPERVDALVEELSRK
ncbi:MAG: beta-lactamase domain protein [Caulobacteraceae bacterium]|nr:beta-lactamase domain protein [Caulobacteraceae bacterium]